MIRLLHTSDSHWSERLRLPDIIAVHREMLEQARELNVDAIVHAGDIFDKRSTAVERTAFAEWLQAAAEIAPVYAVKGNHDAAGDLEIFNRLETRHPICIEERVTRPGQAFVIGQTWDKVSVGFVGLAWADRAHIAASLEATSGTDETRERTIAALRDILTGLRAEASRLREIGVVPIMVTHVMIGGSTVSSGQVLIGQGVELSPADLAEVGAAYVACGHIHAAQEFQGGLVAYSGSPVRHDFGEKEAKGFRLVKLQNDGSLISNEFVELGARRIELLEADYTEPQALAHLKEHGINICTALSEAARTKGALVRFRYRIASKDLHLVDAAGVEKLLLADGAVEVKVEAIVESSTRARAPQIVTSTSLVEKVDTYLDAKEITVDDITRERLHTKVGALEGGLRAAV